MIQKLYSSVLTRKTDNIVFLSEGQIETIKWIAVIAMICDHAQIGFHEDLPMWLRAIGRIAFPLFAFILCYNYINNTSHQNKYLFRLLIAGLISQLPYIFFLESARFNIIITLFCGLLFAEILEYVIQKKKNLIFNYAWFFLLLFLFEPLISYGALGLILIILIFRLCKTEDKTFFLPIIIALAFLNMGRIDFMIFSEISILIVLLVYHLKLEFPRTNKWFFYLFYPLHLVVIKTATNIV